MHQRQLVYALIGSCLCMIRKLREERNRLYTCLVLTYGILVLMLVRRFRCNNHVNSTCSFYTR
jgi:cell division protein FtsW (lipid II flippase)